MLRIYEGQIQYHRNGVGGDSFYVVKFYDEETESDLIAVIPSSMRDDDSDYKCYVIDPSDPVNAKWRGDVLYYGLVEAGLWDIVKSADDGYIASLMERLTGQVEAAS